MRVFQPSNVSDVPTRPFQTCRPERNLSMKLGLAEGLDLGGEAGGEAGGEMGGEGRGEGGGGGRWEVGVAVGLNLSRASSKKLLMCESPFHLRDKARCAMSESPAQDPLCPRRPPRTGTARCRPVRSGKSCHGARMPAGRHTQLSTSRPPYWAAGPRPCRLALRTQQPRA